MVRQMKRLFNEKRVKSQPISHKSKDKGNLLSSTFKVQKSNLPSRAKILSLQSPNMFDHSLHSHLLHFGNLKCAFCNDFWRRHQLGPCLFWLSVCPLFWPLPGKPGKYLKYSQSKSLIGMFLHINYCVTVKIWWYFLQLTLHINC